MTELSEMKKHYLDGTWSEHFSDVFNKLKRSENQDLYKFMLKVIIENKNEKYVEESLRSLKFYSISTGTEEEKKLIISAIQKIVLDNRSSSEIRERAIIELGNLGNWPDTALKEILAGDEDSYLKVYAFRSILTQLKLPEQVIDLETELATNGDIEPSFARIELVTQARADGHFDHLT